MEKKTGYWVCDSMWSDLRKANGKTFTLAEKNVYALISNLVKYKSEHPEVIQSINLDYVAKRLQITYRTVLSCITTLSKEGLLKPKRTTRFESYEFGIAEYQNDTHNNGTESSGVKITPDTDEKITPDTDEKITPKYKSENKKAIGCSIDTYSNSTLLPIEASIDSKVPIESKKEEKKPAYNSTYSTGTLYSKGSTVGSEATNETASYSAPISEIEDIVGRFKVPVGIVAKLPGYQVEGYLKEHYPSFLKEFRDKGLSMNELRNYINNNKLKIS